MADATLPRPALSGADIVILAALLAASGVMAWIMHRREAAGRAAVEGRPWPAATWTGGDVGLCLGIALCSVLVSGLVAGPEATLPARIAAGGFGFLLGTLATVALLRSRGVSWQSIGLTSFDPAGDLRLALGGLVFVAGPLMVIATALDRYVAYEHPVMEALAPAPDAAAIAVIVFAAVIAAPIAEEFFFRRILLGWLDRRLPSPGSATAILLSSLAFGLAHWGQGLAWIPLMLFGGVLGELARRRGSLVPSILLHALFNGSSVVLLLLQLAGRR